jgi:hypothetical protein
MGATEYTLINTDGLAYTTASGTQYDTELPGPPSSSVPDGGTTIAMLGMGVVGLTILRRFAG